MYAIFTGISFNHLLHGLCIGLTVGFCHIYIVLMAVIPFEVCKYLFPVCSLTLHFFPMGFLRVKD